MFDFITEWYRRYFSHPQAVLMVILLVAGTLIIAYFGGMLAPLLASVIIAYLLEGSVQALERWRLKRLLAVSVVFVLFLAVLIFLLIVLLPLISRQLTNFVQDLPSMLERSVQVAYKLPEAYPALFSEAQVDEFIATVRSEIGRLGQTVLSTSIASIPVMIAIIVYAILGPILVFFFLKDKDKITRWITSFMPEDRTLLNNVWAEMDDQIGNYVRGKVYEIGIVGTVSYAVFEILGLNYAPLLGVLVGLSVVVPYIGAAVVTVPIALAGYLQLGWTSEFAWIMAAYGIIQALDGNLLVPLLFSEAVNLHPVAIIVAVLVFGGLWGFWGVFFAIPLATLVNALLNAWPSGIGDGTLQEQAEAAAPLPAGDRSAA
ncbi:MAG: AI-2E family transporter [Gammaproteobacteria bacterium]|nr:AI-2E family transporter [Gammaproteobacteria bacterium]